MACLPLQEFAQLLTLHIALMGAQLRVAAKTARRPLCAEAGGWPSLRQEDGIAARGKHNERGRSRMEVAYYGTS